MKESHGQWERQLRRSEWDSHSPYSYEIHGTNIDDEFEIGVRAAPGETPRPDIVPSPIYTTITEMVTDEADLDAVAVSTTDDTWPIIGECNVSKLDEERILIEVRLRSQWRRH